MNPGAAAANAPPGAFARRLRAETRADHDRTEALAPLVALVSPSLDRAAYVTALRLLHRFFAPADRALRAGALGGGRGWGYGRARRFPHLEADLRVLGAAPPPPAPGDDAAVAGELDLLAHAYLLEGSALGGRVLARRVAASLGLDPETGLGWFHGHGADAGPRWRRFLAYLDAQVAGTGAEEALIVAVRRAYRRLRVVAGEVAADASRGATPPARPGPPAGVRSARAPR